MAPKKREKKGKKYRLELSVSSTLFWGLGFLFLLAWFFVLGVLVGRGSLSDGVTFLTEIKAKVDKLQAMISRTDSSDLDVIKKLGKAPKFAFYDELSIKKEEVTTKGPQEKKRWTGQIEPDKRIKPIKKNAGVYTVQVASLGNEISAVKMINRLNSQGYPAYFYKVNLKGKIYYRVRCGKFKKKEEAANFKRMLGKEEQIKGFVTRVER